MYYFKRNIGDYHKKAGRLSMLEHGAYTLLMDSCYDRERFPNLDDAIEWCWARTPEEIAAVEFVLRKFFTLDDGVYVQQRIKDEIEAFHGKSEKNKQIALDREAKRRNERTRNVQEVARNVNETPPNQEPRTINQEPLKDKSFCNEPKSSALEEKKINSPVVMELPLNKTGTFHQVSQSDVDEFTQLYPAVDVIQEFRGMRGWCNSNPTKLKTSSGIKRFINSWLAKAQNNPAPNRSSSSTANYGEKQVNGLKDAYSSFAMPEIKAQERIGYDC